MKRFLTCLTALLLLAPFTAWSQRPPAVVTGQVMIMDSMRPAARVFVRSAALNVGTLTDSTGFYRLVVPGARVVDGSSVEITAGRPGLVPERRQIVLTSGETVVMDFAVKTWSPLEDRPCYDMVTGYPAGTIPRTTDLAALDKLCRLTVLWNRRAFR